MEARTRRYEIEGYGLYPSDKFDTLLDYCPDEVIESTTMKRFGILTEQLNPLREILVIDSSSDNVSNQDLVIKPADNDPPLDLSILNQRAVIVEKNALGEDNRLIWNKREYLEDVVSAVRWLLYGLRNEFGTRRKRAIGAFCEKTGLNGYRQDPSQSGGSSSDGGDGDNPGLFEHDIDLRNLSKL